MINQFWISPEADIIPIEEHPIKCVVKDPQFFGYSTNQMQLIYAKYDDANELEGEATKTLISDMIQRGWVYCIKKSPRHDWRIEVNKLSKKTRFNLKIWAGQLLEDNQLNLDDMLIFHRHFKKDTIKKFVVELMEDELFSP